jgi:DNA-binding NtrC family response regulator
MMSANILLVDDEEAFVETMAKRLTKRGMTVTTAFDGDQALQRLEEAPSVEVVVLDVKMPGLDGIDVLTAIKAKYPILEVIMLTGHATVETAIEGMKLGAFDFLVKPCDMEQLVAKVDEAAARKRRHDEKIIEARMNAITSRLA